MKRAWILFSAIVLTAAAPTRGQQGGEPATSLPDDFKPASTNIVGQQFPQVNSARQVRFRINAPQVQSIRVMGTNLEHFHF